MSNGERTTSTGTVIGFGFIILGILNFFAGHFYHRNAVHSHSNKIPALLFITTGVIILVVRIIKKSKEQ